MTRPDYCPVAQEPCQAMCVLSDVRCKIRDSPPAQPAVPLTDEQIDEIVNRLDPLFLDVPESFTTDFARAIEAAHGITEKGQP